MPQPKKQKVHRKKRLVLNLFHTGSLPSNYSGVWRHPDNKADEFQSLEYWVQLAKLAEKGKLNAIFVADVLTYFDVYENSFAPAARVGYNVPKVDPSAYVTAMASVTKSLGFGITFSTVSEHPYSLTRRLASLDSLTKGRLGWNIVSSYLPSTGSQLLNGEKLDKHDDRYSRLQEYTDASAQLLLSSWRDDALIYDKDNGLFADPERIRKIDFNGKYFNIPGPSISEPTPQRFPVVIQAGTSTAGKEFASKHAEVIFLAAKVLKEVGDNIREIRELAKKAGRDPQSLKFIISSSPIIGDTHEEAVTKLEDILKYWDPEGSQVAFSGYTGIDLAQYGWDEEIGYKNDESQARRAMANTVLAKKNGKGTTRRKIAEGSKNGQNGPTLVGTPSEIADIIQEYVDLYDIDGFNLIPTLFPSSVEDIVDKLIPELQRRGLFWEDYAVKGGTFRENIYGIKGQTFLPDDHPYHHLRWKKGISKEEFEKSLK